MRQPPTTKQNASLGLHNAKRRRTVEGCRAVGHCPHFRQLAAGLFGLPQTSRFSPTGGQVKRRSETEFGAISGIHTGNSKRAFGQRQENSGQARRTLPLDCPKHNCKLGLSHAPLKTKLGDDIGTPAPNTWPDFFGIYGRSLCTPNESPASSPYG